MSQRSYSGPALDLSWQYFSERPLARADGGDDQDDVALEGEDELVYATPAEPKGEERTVNVVSRPDVEGQSTLEDWGWTA